MKVINALFLTASLGLAAAPGAWAASTLVFNISRVNANDALITWSVTGPLVGAGQTVDTPGYAGAWPVSFPGLFSQSFSFVQTALTGAGQFYDTIDSVYYPLTHLGINSGGGSPGSYAANLQLGTYGGVLAGLSGHVFTYIPGSGDSVVLAGSYSAFNNGQYSGNVGGYPLTINGQLNNLSAVPEPSEWAAISFGVLGIVWMAKRRFMPARA